MLSVLSYNAEIRFATLLQNFYDSNDNNIVDFLLGECQESMNTEIMGLLRKFEYWSQSELYFQNVVEQPNCRRNGRSVPRLQPRMCKRFRVLYPPSILQKLQQPANPLSRGPH